MSYVFGANVGMVSAGGSTYIPSGMPSGWAPGGLLALATTNTDFSQTASIPAGYTLVSLNSAVTFCSLFVRVAQPSDTPPSVVYTGGTAIGEFVYFSGLATATVDPNVQLERSSSSTNILSFSAVTRTPSQDNCVIFAWGARQKFAATNGGTYGSVNIGGFHQISEIVIAGSSISAALYYSIQTTATSMASAATSFSLSESTARPEGGNLTAIQLGTGVVQGLMSWPTQVFVNDIITQF